jgi:hypothetical protein
LCLYMCSIHSAYFSVCTEISLYYEHSLKFLMNYAVGAKNVFAQHDKQSNGGKIRLHMILTSILELRRSLQLFIIDITFLSSYM